MSFLQVLILAVATGLPIASANVILQPDYEHVSSAHIAYPSLYWHEQSIPAKISQTIVNYAHYQFEPYHTTNSYGIGGENQSPYVGYAIIPYHDILSLALPRKQIHYAGSVMHTPRFIQHSGFPPAAYHLRAKRATEEHGKEGFVENVSADSSVNDFPVRLATHDDVSKLSPNENSANEKFLNVRQSKQDDAIVGSPFMGLGPRNVYPGSHGYMSGMFAKPMEQPITLRVVHPDDRSNGAKQPESLASQQAETHDAKANNEGEGEWGTTAHQADPEETLQQMIKKIEQGIRPSVEQTKNDELLRFNQQPPTIVLRNMLDQMGRVGNQWTMPENMMYQMAGPYRAPAYNTYYRTSDNAASPALAYYRNDLQQDQIVRLNPAGYPTIAQNIDTSQSSEYKQNSMENSMMKMAQINQNPTIGAEAPNTMEDSGHLNEDPVLKNFPDPRPAPIDEPHDKTDNQRSNENHESDIQEETDGMEKSESNAEESPIVGTFIKKHDLITSVPPIYVPYKAPSPTTYISPTATYILPVQNNVIPSPTYVYESPSYSSPYVMESYLLYPDTYYRDNSRKLRQTYFHDHHLHPHLHIDHSHSLVHPHIHPHVHPNVHSHVHIDHMHSHPIHHPHIHYTPPHYHHYLHPGSSLVHFRNARSDCSTDDNTNNAMYVQS